MRGPEPGGVLDPATFAQLQAIARGPPSEAGDPEPDAVPENIQQMMAALNIAPSSAAPAAAAKQVAMTRSGNALGGYAIRAQHAAGLDSSRAAPFRSDQ